MYKLFKKKFLIFKKVLKVILSPFYYFLKSIEFRRTIIYAYMYHFVKVKERSILFESYHGANMTGNPYSIFKYIADNEEFSDYTFIWVINDTNNDHVKKYSSLDNVRFVRRNSLRYILYLCQSKYLINDTTFPNYFIKKEEQIYVNTWHGTPFKTLGKDIIGMMGQHKNALRNFLHTDYIISPNNYTSNILLASHDLEGIYDGIIVEEGHPRNDLTINADKVVIKERLKKIIDIDFSKKVILYAPTWRGIGKVENTGKEITRIFTEMHDSMPNDCVLLLKVHSLTYRYLEGNKKLKNICIPDWFETNELLSVVDVLITDYSSIWIDYLVTNNPIVFYLYDKEKYKKERGVYLSLDELPGAVCNNISEVIGAIKNTNEVSDPFVSKYRVMKEKFCYKDDGAVTERIVNIVFKGISSRNTYRNQSDKVKILMYGGGFTTNGVTSATINLLNGIDYQKYDVTLIYGGKLVKEVTNNLKKLSSNVKIIYREGSFNFRFLEYFKHRLLLYFGLDKGWKKKLISKGSYKTELYRMIGNSKHDICIDISGYAPFWALLFAFSNINKKCIYLHSDMAADYNRKVNGKYIFRKSFNVIFHLYKHFNKLVTVSKSSMEANIKNLERLNVGNKIVCTNNVLNSERVLNCLKEDLIIRKMNQEYLIMNEQSDLEVTVFNGIPVPSHNNINFVTVGRLSPEKSHERLIYAFSKVNKMYSNTMLYIVGDGPLRLYLRNLVVKLGLEKNVILTGQTDNPFVLVNKCSCFILSSQYEGQALVLLEALILTKPVVSTDIPGPRSVLEDGYGELVENSEDGLVQGMIRFINGEIKSKTFDYKEYNKIALEMFYKEVLSGDEKEARNR